MKGIYNDGFERARCIYDEHYGESNEWPDDSQYEDEYNYDCDETEQPDEDSFEYEQEEIPEEEPIFPCSVGDSIHIHSRQGIYTVLDITKEYITITCGKWQRQYNSGMIGSNVRIVPLSDYKCHRG